MAGRRRRRRLHRLHPLRDPHLSLGAELSHDATARVRVFGARQLLRVGGTLVCAGIGVQLLEDLDGARESARWLALGSGLATVVALVLAVARLPAEREDHVGRGGQSPLGAIRDVWGNRRARRVLFVLFIESLGSGGNPVLLPYVMRYIVKRPELTSEMLLLLYAVSLGAVPLWGVHKLGGALMAGGTLLLLDAVGYVPGAEQSEETRLGMRLLMEAVPIAGYAIGIAAFLRFDFGEAEHRRIAALLADRPRARKSAP